MKITYFKIAATAIMLVAVGCSNDDPSMPDAPEWGTPSGPVGGMGVEDSDVPDFDREIKPYSGQLANDAHNDAVGDNADIFWEQNQFKKTVKVTYSGESAMVEINNADVSWHIDGAHVTVDLLTNAVSGVEIILSGNSSDGSLKVYGEKKFKLTLNGVNLASLRGPAINNQCKKRVFVHLADGTVNSLADASSYKSDLFYIGGATEDSEDRKGCLFSEGNLIFSGHGALLVAGKHKHGIASDGYMYTRPGVTIAVTEAAKNAFHIKGAKTDELLLGYKGLNDPEVGMGIVIAGGYIYANAQAEAGKAIKTDYHLQMLGGTLDLNTSGNAIYDSEEDDTSSASGIKTDGNIYVEGGNISVKSSGEGGKGLNADGNLTVTGGSVTISTIGGKYVYDASRDLDSSPKGIKIDGNIHIIDGKVNVSVTGVSDGSEGMESKSEITIDGGEIYVYTYDDAINASTGITINGGRIYAYAINNDAIDSNGFLNINGGLVLAFGADGSEESLDCEYTNKFLVNGGLVMGLSGTSMTKPSSSSAQRVAIYGGASLAKGEKTAVLDSKGIPVLTFTAPRTYNRATIFLSAPSFAANATYSISKGGDISGYADSWNGWYGEGSWTGGTNIGSFSSNNVITSVGTTGQGGFPGGPGGGFGPR